MVIVMLILFDSEFVWLVVLVLLNVCLLLVEVLVFLNRLSRLVVGGVMLFEFVLLSFEFVDFDVVVCLISMMVSGLLILCVC